MSPKIEVTDDMVERALDAIEVKFPLFRRYDDTEDVTRAMLEAALNPPDLRKGGDRRKPRIPSAWVDPSAQVGTLDARKCKCDGTYVHGTYVFDTETVINVTCMECGRTISDRRVATPSGTVSVNFRSERQNNGNFHHWRLSDRQACAPNHQHRRSTDS